MISTLRYQVYAPIGIIINRGMVRMMRRPSLIMPVIIMPLFFLIAFSGSFDALGDIPSYGTDNVVDWMLPFAALQGSAFAGVGSSSITAEDIEGGFYDRILTSPTRRSVLLLGTIFYTMVRAFLPITFVTIAGLFLNASFSGGLAGVGMLYIGGLGLAAVLTCLGLNLVYRLRTQRTLAMVQVVTFVFLFLSIGQVPIAIMEGWLKSAARVNPITNIIRLARQGMIGDVTWANTWPGLLAIASLCLIFGFGALFNLKRMNR